MTKQVNLFSLFLLFFAASYAQTPYSYYYKGQKINLEVNKSVVHVVADTALLQSSNSSQLFEPLLSEPRFSQDFQDEQDYKKMYLCK